MAKPKKEPTPAAPAEPVSTMSAEERLNAILLAAISMPERGVPVLIGPTQWGKTRHLWDFYTQKLGIEPKNIVMMNPQNDLPEDIGGWPSRNGDYLTFTQPANIPPHLIDPKNYDPKTGDPLVPWGIIVDEIDKANEDTLSAMLTFFNPDERRLRTTRIHRKVPITGAMNEPENRIIPEPLLARLLFLQYPIEGMKVAARADLRALEMVAAELFTTLPAVQFPARPKAPGSLHKLAKWINTEIFWDDPVARKEIVRGLFNAQDTAVVLSKLQERMPEPSEEWARSVRPTDMIKNIVRVLSAGSYEADVNVLRVLVERAKPENDPTREMERLLTALLETPSALHAVNRPEYVAQGQADLMKKISELDAAREKSKEKETK